MQSLLKATTHLEDVRTWYVQCIYIFKEKMQKSDLFN